jgi:hypothetical protein
MLVTCPCNDKLQLVYISGYLPVGRWPATKERNRSAQITLLVDACAIFAIIYQLAHARVPHSLKGTEL